MKKCESFEELKEHLDALAAEDKKGDVIIEEFIDIEKEYDIPGLANGSDVLIPAIIEKGIIHRGVTGSGTIMSFADKFPEIQKKLEEMIGTMGFTGLVDVELFEQNGKIYFNELNMRFGASGYALTGSGVNLPIRLLSILTKPGSRKLKKDLDVPTKTFSSEKVIFQEFWDDSVSWKEFKKTNSEADFCFLENKEDPAPYRRFLLDANKKRTKRLILRKVLRRK